MYGMLNYLDDYGDNTFLQAPFNHVDNLVLAEMCYLDFENILPNLRRAPESKPLRQVAAEYATFLKDGQRKTDKLVNRFDISLIEKMAETRRFGDIAMCCYTTEVDLEIEKQFAALVYCLSDEVHYLAFRGTDNNIVGWKEDFMSSYLSSTPSQQDALNYLNTVFDKFDGRFYVGGHSKGGNLAVYASSKTTAANKARILQVYNNDGPGFSKDFIDSADYNEILPKITTILPQFSIIGQLLEQKGEPIIIDSSGLGFAQHLPQTWRIDHNDFVRAEMRESARLLNQAINNWMDQLSVEKRKIFVDTLFDIFGSSDGEEAIVPLSESIKHLQKIKERYKSIDDEAKQEMESAFDLLKQEIVTAFQASIKSIFSKSDKEASDEAKDTPLPKNT